MTVLINWQKFIANSNSNLLIPMKFLISFLITWFLLAEYSKSDTYGCFFDGSLMIAHESFYLLSNITW